MSRLFVIITILFSMFSAFAEEESLDLNSLTTSSSSAAAPQIQMPFQIMGRVDLTFDQTVDSNSDLKNNHFLLFLKSHASKKVSFMGEFVGQNFYYVDYRNSDSLTVSFGKILIPFGDNRYFHHYYGGLQGYGASGVMFKNIWAEPGVNANWSLGPLSLDTYWVNGINASSISTDVDLQSSTTERQALGTRLQGPLADKIQWIGSAYYSDYWPGRALYMGGMDLYTSYGALGLSAVRFSLGIANAWVEGSPTGRNFQKRGDYFQVATNVLSWAEWRIRYGTYEDDNRVETIDDTQSFNLGATIPVDVLKILIEHQWNYEAKNEMNNDQSRIMVSLDF